jgi:threonine aldolase
MVFFTIDAQTAGELGNYLKEKNILISAGPVTRLVTHLGISAEDIHYTLEQITTFFDSRQV